MRREEHIQQTSPLPAGYTQLDHIEFTGTQGLYLPDFIFNESDNKPGVYDLVSNTFFTSATGTDFLYA